jgi:hypothetical protein
METRAFRHLWGYPITSDATFRKIRDNGYLGIETGLHIIDDADAFRHGLKRNDLQLIGQVYTAGFSKGHCVEEHLKSLKAQVEMLLPLEPVLINAHSGEDTWSLDDMHRYFRETEYLQKSVSVPIAHETHRGRCLFHPTIARILLESHPDIRLVSDLSHWVCVCERLLEDQDPVIALAAERTVHVHTRIGYSQGPQVSDPRSELAAVERAVFENWWKTIYHVMERMGLRAFSFCPEYGPPPYLPVLPFTGMPVADLDCICNWQATRVRELAIGWTE